MSEKDLALFSDSYERCRRHAQFLGRFHQLFLNSSEEVAAKFAHVDFRRQKALLASSLYSMMTFARRRQHPLPDLERIAEIHSRRGHDIRPHLYGLWMECLLGAVRECDPQFDADVERAWRRIIGQGIDFMTTRY